MEEREMIVRIQRGDMEAFEALFQLYKDKAMRTVYLMTGNQMASEDIVQEAFTTCYLSVKTLKNPEYFKTWFFKLLTRIAWRHMKKEKRLVPIEEIGELIERDKRGYYPDVMEERERARVLYNEILKLDLKLQTTLILYYYNELSVSEIARVMGCLEGTVKSRLYTGRKRLKLTLEEEKRYSSPRERLGYGKP